MKHRVINYGTKMARFEPFGLPGFLFGTSGKAGGALVSAGVVVGVGVECITACSCMFT